MTAAPTRLLCADRILDLEAPLVMGVLNVTPDSFSDGGRFVDAGAALEQARRLVAEGAAIVDVGGESTRPGAARPGVEEELGRVLPVVRAIARELDVAISVDTSRAEVVEQVAAAGAHLLNDVRGLREPGTLRAAARARLGICVMHMQGEPDTMQVDPRYEDVVAEVRDWLAARVAACREAGVDAESLLVDPGFGFGKRLEHNLALLARLEEFTRLGAALLVGLSRKSMVGTLTGRDLESRLPGSVALAALAASRGANVIRAHDVGPTLDAVRVGAALRRADLEQA